MATADPPISVDFGNVQAHYDLSDDFFRLFLDPSMTYSCAKFDHAETTLAEAQRAKIDLTLGKCELEPGQRLLDIGCGWGALALRAREMHDVRVVGLTLSRNQFEHNRKLAERSAGGGARGGLEFRLQGWETFEEKVDRIVSVGAFEHFGLDKYGPFFARCHSMLPEGGVLLLHTITVGKPTASFAFLRFLAFLRTRIFPGGGSPIPERIIEFARAASLELVHAESLRPHYARTLDCWAENLRSNEPAALAMVGAKIYQTYIKYLTDCAHWFRSGECNVYQFKLRKG